MSLHPSNDLVDWHRAIFLRDMPLPLPQSVELLEEWLALCRAKGTRGPARAMRE